MAEMNSKETIFSIAKENRALRWIIIFLSIGLTVCAGTIFMITHRPQMVWVVTDNGRIVNSNGLFFEWEAREAARLAIKSFYQINSNRDSYLKEYYTESFITPKKSFKPSDYNVGFEVNKVDYKDNGDIIVVGDFSRGNTVPYPLIVTLKKTERTNLNPFGLMVIDAKKEEKKGEPVEDALMSVSVSTHLPAVSTPMGKAH